MPPTRCGRSQPPVETDRTDKPRWVRDHRFNEASNGYDNRAIFEPPKMRFGIRAPEAELRILRYLDTKHQRVYDKLEQTGEADDTLAFFIGDNGYQWREHGEVGATAWTRLRSAGRRGDPDSLLRPPDKAKPYLDAVRVPFLMRWLDSPLVSGDHRENLPADRNIDLATTVMDVIDQAPQTSLGEPPMDGRSILSPWQREYLFAEGAVGAEGGLFPANTPAWKALISPSLHFISYADDPWTASVDDPFLERYDLTTDLIEHENLYGPGGAYDPGLGKLGSEALLGLIDEIRRLLGFQLPVGDLGGTVTTRGPRLQWDRTLCTSTTCWSSWAGSAP